MKQGNWIALHKELKYFLPTGREYTILEAMFSYTLDADNGKEGTISGYSKLWGWSRTKVRKFVEELKTGEGHLTNRQRTGKRHQVLLKLNNLQDRKDTLKTGKEQLKDTLVDTTINPNPKPDPKPKEKPVVFDFDTVWKRYPNNDGRKLAIKSFNSTVKTEEDYAAINKALDNYLMSEKVLKGFIKNGSTWFNNWQDWIEVEEQEHAFAKKEF
jgi:hypothetical protein